MVAALLLGSAFYSHAPFPRLYVYNETFRNLDGKAALLLPVAQILLLTLNCFTVLSLLDYVFIHKSKHGIRDCFINVLSQNVELLSAENIYSLRDCKATL